MNNKAGVIEYKMPEKMGKELLKSRKGEDQRLSPNDFLRKIINNEYGLKGECVKVTLY